MGLACLKTCKAASVAVGVESHEEGVLRAGEALQILGLWAQEWCDLTFLFKVCFVDSRSVMYDSLQPHGHLQARILEWVAYPFSSRSYQPRTRTGVSCIAGGFFTNWTIRETGRNINNPRYADDTTLMAESKEELKSFLMKVKEESKKVGLKYNIQKKLRSWYLVPSFHGK